ncbi:alpha/beta hydrolase family protein [Streptomyces sp. NPDC058701]|uniref:bis(hydroxyethyl) terephthalate hydrolase n=1 Tax=Streptomyces sp. NPDC058701 TaxID=3346608 RepID=UPI0036679341
MQQQNSESPHRAHGTDASAGPGTGAARAAGRPARRTARFRSLVAGAAVLLAVGGFTTATTPDARAAANPYERGPAPTVSSIEAARGSYAVSQTTVSSLSVTGFGGGTVYYPTSTGDGTFGAVVISPGYTASQSSIAWLGPRLASQGFVVLTIDTLTTLDQPDSRGRQLLAALDYLTGRSAVRTRIDSSRLGVMGHSMGGGGTLEAAKSRPSLQAAIPLTGWNLDKSWPEIQTPTLVIGADGDSIAPVGTHSEPFYESLPGSLDKAYLELNGATHFTPNSSNTTIAKYSIAWLKRFIDNDVRYEQFLCPLPRPGLTIEEYRGNCPHAS